MGGGTGTGWGARGGGHGVGGTGRWTWCGGHGVGAQRISRAQPATGGALGMLVMFFPFPFPFLSSFPSLFSSPFPFLSPFPELPSQGISGTRWSQLPPRAGLGLLVLPWCCGEQFPLWGWDETPQSCHWEPRPAGVSGSSGATIGDPVGDTVGAPRRRP